MEKYFNNNTSQTQTFVEVHEDKITTFAVNIIYTITPLQQSQLIVRCCPIIGHKHNITYLNTSIILMYLNFASLNSDQSHN